MVREVSDAALSERSSRVEELERTLETLREDSEVAHVLLGLSGALAEVRTVQETLDKAVRVVQELFKADRCYATAIDETEQSFEIRAHSGVDPELLEVLAGLAARDRRGLPLMAEALSTGAPLLIPDIVTGDRLTPQEAAERRLQAYIGIPLVRWGQDFGGLAIEFSEPQAFSSKEAALARGWPVRWAWPSPTRRFNLLQSLRTIGLSVGSQLRAGAVARQVARGARKLLNAEGAVLYFFDSASNTLIASGTDGLAQATFQWIATLDLSRAPWSDLPGAAR